MGIIQICILFYFLREYFEKIGKLSKLSDDKLTITNISIDGDWSTCYGAQLIKANTNLIHKWKLRINELDPNPVLCIGIDDSNGKFVDKCFSQQRTSMNYAYKANATKRVQNKSSNYGTQWKQNDIIEMIVNLSKQTISYAVNNKNQGIAFSKIKKDNNTIYRLAAYIFDPGDSITLLNYSCSG